jgi:hypothetical protein
MANKIKPKRSYTANAVPTTSDLDANELAINWADGKAYTKNAAGNIVSVTLGGGSGSTEDSVLRALFVPAAPTGLTVTAGNASAALSWTAPTGVIAQAPITDYREQYSNDNGATWTTFTAAASTATSATVTGLTNGTAYTFRVAAVNGVGVGAYSAASSAVTPTAGTPPNAPTSLTATAGNAQIALSWTAPSAPGTSAITGYTVEYTPSGGSAQTVSTGSTGTSYTLTGLTNGTAYTVRVAGVSAAGTGNYSGTATGTPAAIVFNSIQANWTGTGSSSDKLTPPQTGNTSGFPGAFTTASFTAGMAGTLKVTPVTNDAFDAHTRKVQKNGVDVQSWVVADPAQVSFSVTSGDVIVLTGGYGSLWNKGTRVWIE